MLRIIAGELKGRKLLPPGDREVTRPITDRVKQAVFDYLDARAMFEEGHILDLYSGTGSLGLEAISRGARVVTFVDRDRDVIERLEKNIDTMGVGDRAKVHRMSVTSMLWMSAAWRQGPVDVAFFDPPYALVQDQQEWQAIELVIQKLYEHMADWGMTVVRVPSKIDAPAIEPWTGPKVRSFGSMRIWLYQRPGAEPVADELL